MIDEGLKLALRVREQIRSMMQMKKLKVEAINGLPDRQERGVDRLAMQALTRAHGCLVWIESCSIEHFAVVQTAHEGQLVVGCDELSSVE